MKSERPEAMKLLTLSAEDLRRALPMPEAVAAMKDAFAALSTGRASSPPRGVVDVEPAEDVTLLMGAYIEKTGLAAKIVSVFPGNAQRGRPVVNALVLVLDPRTGEPVALCDGTYLTALRTGAASGAATALLAGEDARVAAVIGCGVQARTQASAIDCVRQLDEIRVCGRRSDSAGGMVDEMRGQTRARLVAVRSADEAVRGADIVYTATNSHAPVFDGTLLAPGTHVNGVGSFKLEMQEVDTETVRRSRVFVDSVEAALAEAGDLVIAARDGVTSSDRWTEIGLVAAGRAEGRRSNSEVTFFKSVGHAVQDVAAASRALGVAREIGLGKEIEL
jgi:ornithine cyclodeaminase